MDWALAIEKNRRALKGVLAMLVAMVGADSAAPTLPRHLHRFVLRLLRPAEAALRRLIIVAARGLAVERAAPRAHRQKPPSIFVRDGIGTGVVLARGRRPDWSHGSSRPATLTFPLLDPLKRRGTRRYVGKRGAPRITFDFDRPRDPEPPPLSPDDPLDANRLHRRLGALALAIDDLPRQALRFARWQARLDAAQTRNGTTGMQVGNMGRNRRLSPMRPGRPPGWCRRPAYAVDELLKELHGLAAWSQKRPDTS